MSLVCFGPRQQQEFVAYARGMHLARTYAMRHVCFGPGRQQEFMHVRCDAKCRCARHGLG
eukprot:15251202-Alexandrium_andersonii.AAC.1